jgi:hypothetical protein
MSKKIIKFILVCSILFSTSVFAWGRAGHLLIDQIAYDNLTPTAKQKVDNLVNVFARDNPDYSNFVQIGEWPDDVRANNIHAFDSWHFIDKPYVQGYSRKEYRYDRENVVWAILQSEKTLSSQNASPEMQAMFLAFLTHFVGDVHQPLHCITLYNRYYPKGDQGGNLYRIQSPIANNLHAYWDLGAGYFPTHTDAATIAKFAQKIESDYPQSFFKDRLNKTDPKNWADESYGIAKNFVYTAKYNQPISTVYESEAYTIVEQQTALAGYRLAQTLNQLFA